MCQNVLDEEVFNQYILSFLSFHVTFSPVLLFCFVFVFVVFVVYLYFLFDL